MTTFYRVDGGRLTLAEYWRLSSDLLSFLFAAGRKLLGVPLRFAFTVPRPDRLFVVEFDELPAAARNAMKHPIRDAERAGFRLAFCHRLPVPEPERVGAAAVLLDGHHESVLVVIFGLHGERREVQLGCVSWFADDTLASTTTARKTLTPVPGADIERYPGADAATLAGLHRDHLERLAARGLVPAALDPHRLSEYVLEWELRYVDFHIERGVFVPMTEDELDALCEG
jgi:hypothetical protein